MRLDIRTFELGLAPSREKARALIMAGVVLVNGKRADKPGITVKETDEISVFKNAIPYVSRGGLKLNKAIEQFSISLTNIVAADIGASTGGFTDCMLQHGAKKVYALDVGYGQLNWSLRNDERVIVMERTNARYILPEWFKEKIDFASIDVSFISLKLILKPLFPCLNENAGVVALIKPQFEAGRNEVQKHGVIKNKETHKQVIKNVFEYAMGFGYEICGLVYSPVKGPKGNIEFLAYLKKASENGNTLSVKYEELISNCVNEAHAGLVK